MAPPEAEPRPDGAQVRELHVVALSEDGRHAVLATSPDAGRGGFRLALDDRLAAALRGELTGPGDTEPRGADLTVKDIQNRLRAGESADEIARSAGVPLARVERFSGPVLSERARMIDAARSAHVVRGRRGPSLLALGEAVEGALELVSGLRPETVEWTTRRDEESRWVVTVAWVARARRRTASWTWDPASHVLTAVDAASAALGHTADPPARRVDPPASAPSQAKVTKRSRAGTRTAPTRTAPTRTAPIRTAPSKKAPSTTAPAEAGRARAARRKVVAATAAPPVRRAVAATRAATAVVQPAAHRATTAAATRATKAPSAARATKAAAARTPRKTTSTGAAPAARRGLRVVPDPTVSRPTPRRTAKDPATAADATPAARTARDGKRDGNRDGVRSRASVPGWADVLLSTSPREDGPGGSR